MDRALHNLTNDLLASPNTTFLPSEHGIRSRRKKHLDAGVEVEIHVPSQPLVEQATATTEDGRSFVLPRAAAARASVLSTKMQDCATDQSASMELCGVDSSGVERCLEYCVQDHLVNTVGAPVQFVFPLDCSTVIDVCNAATALNIPPLVHLTTRFIAAHIDQLESVHTLPNSVLSQIIRRISLPKLCRLQASSQSEAMSHATLEAKDIWQSACERQGWEPSSDDDPRWSAALVSDEPPVQASSTTSSVAVWRRTYVFRRLAALEASLVSGAEASSTLLGFIDDCQSELGHHAPNQEAVAAMRMKWWDYLGRFGSLTTVELSNWTLCREDMAALAKFLAARPQVHTVALRDAGISDDLVEALADVLVHPECRGLKRLDLSGNYISAQGCQSLADAVRKSGLKALRLNRNFIGRDFFIDGSGGTFLSSQPPQGGGLGALLDAAVMCDLQFIDCSSNRIHLKDVPASSWGNIEKMPRAPLDSLDLSHNNLAGGDKEAGKAAVSQLFRSACKKAKRLVMAGCGLTAEHLSDWAMCDHYLNDMGKKADSVCNDPIECLDISHNAVGDAGLFALAEVCARREFTALHLSDVHASDEGAEALSTSLQKSGFVKCLDVSRNNFSAEGVEWLQKVVLATATLEVHTHMWLARCGIPFEVRAKIWNAVWKSDSASAYGYNVSAFLNNVSEEDGKRLAAMQCARQRVVCSV